MLRPAQITTVLSVVIVFVMFAIALHIEDEARRMFALLLVGWLTADTVERFSRAWFR